MVTSAEESVPQPSHGVTSTGQSVPQPSHGPAAQQQLCNRGTPQAGLLTKTKRAAQAAGSDPSRCNSTNRQNPSLQKKMALTFEPLMGS